MRYKGKIYKRIMLLGNSGSGKSWTAQRLGEKTGYPVIYLDKECWQPGWTYPPQEEWEKKNREYISGREWIIDGNHHETLEMRVEAADLILLFDINRLLCIYSVWKRHGHKRVDFPDYLDEKKDRAFWQFLGWVWKFPEKCRPGILNIRKNHPEIMFLTFRTRKEVSEFLNEIEP